MRLSFRWNAALAVVVAGISISQTALAQNPADIERQVTDIFSRTCARVGCHAGSDPQMGMSLEPGVFFSHTVGRPSRERPDLHLVHPGAPDSSYLFKKVRGDADIVGAPMPLTGDRLSEQELTTIESWIDSLSVEDVAERMTTAMPRTTNPFAGWKAVNLPTTRMVDRGLWLFLISHRFNPTLSDGYEAFYGLDGSSIIFLNLGYAPSDNLFFLLGRSNAEDDVELQAKYRFLQQRADGGLPVGLAAQAAVNWITEKSGDEDRLRSENFKLSGQLILSSELAPGLGVLVVPGVLFNPARAADDESPLVTLGVAGRWHFHRTMSLVGEWVPIVSGYTRTNIFGNDNRFDSWGGGLEIAVGGHVFQIVLSNSVGLATDQYMRGGDLDVRDFFDGEIRLGFNIFRLLAF